MTTHTNPDRTELAVPVVPGDLFARHQVITGMRALADFLEANPAVPVSEFGNDLLVFVRDVDDAVAVARVDQAAALLGVEVDDDTRWGGHYAATRTFGRITYRIVHIPDRSRREHDAQMSYCDNIRLDPDQNDDQDEQGADGSGRAA